MSTVAAVAPTGAVEASMSAAPTGAVEAGMPTAPTMPISCREASGAAEADLRRVVGLADLCELLAATFAFPASEELANALASGTYLADAAGCLADAGCPAAQARDACRELEAFVGRDTAGLAQDLRRGHSLLFLSPGSKGPVWPYEGAFRFAATGTAEAPSLFRSPVTLQVEKAMGEAGLLPTTAHTEPVDSIWGELGFLSQLYGHQAQASAHRLALAQEAAGDGGAHEPGATGHLSAALASWAGRAAAFTREHVAVWMPDFMERTRCRAEAGDLSYGAEYAALARFGATAVQALVAGSR